MTSKIRRNWKRIRPTSLPHAMELCLDHARERLNRSVDNVADLMGVTNKWNLYKWVQSGNLPARLIPPFEAACGINFISLWLASGANKLLIDIPTGKNVSPTSLAVMQQNFSQAFAHLANFYEQQTEPDDTLFALQLTMGDIGWHHANVSTYAQPELDFSEEE